jgi:hypothetical protein
MPEPDQELVTHAEQMTVLVAELATEVDRLRAGEDLTPPREGAELTAGQFIKRLNDMTAENRLQTIEQLLGAARRATTCYTIDHPGLIQSLRDNIGRLERRVEMLDAAVDQMAAVMNDCERCQEKMDSVDE